MATSKILFKTAYGEREPYYTEPGDGMIEEYGYEINKYGQKVLVKTGESSLYDKIQESLEETKIENILQRVAMGDNTVMRPDGIYADLTDAPKNLIEARQQMQKLENLWDNLPIDTKREYDFSLDSFIAQSGSEKWLNDMGLLEKGESKTAKQVTEPKNNEEGGSEA